MYKSPKLLIFLNKLFMYIYFHHISSFIVNHYISKNCYKESLEQLLNEFEKILIDNLRIPLAFFGIILVFE